MSEQLSSDDNWKAGRLYKDHTMGEKYELPGIAHAESKTRAAAALITDYDPNARYRIKVEKDDNPHFSQRFGITPLATLEEERQNMQVALQANLWEAREHKEAHLGEYIETARQEAEADGKQINLQPPTEHQ